jgi:hypothetical protein
LDQPAPSEWLDTPLLKEEEPEGAMVMGIRTLLALDPELALDPVRVTGLESMRAVGVEAEAVLGRSLVVLGLVLGMAVDLALVLARNHVTVTVGLPVPGAVVAAAVVDKVRQMWTLMAMVPVVAKGTAPA